MGKIVGVRSENMTRPDEVKLISGRLISDKINSIWGYMINQFIIIIDRDEQTNNIICAKTNYGKNLEQIRELIQTGDIFANDDNLKTLIYSMAYDKDSEIIKILSENQLHSRIFVGPIFIGNAQ